jgi:hypothetical protein
MDPERQDRPVTSGSRKRSPWPNGSRELAVALQQRLAIGDRDWHALKSQRSRRAAEQLSAALVQLLAEDDSAAMETSSKRLDAIALVEHSLLWLRQEISDPGCPDHRR